MAKGNNGSGDKPVAKVAEEILLKAKKEAGEIVQAAHDKADEIIKDSTDAANKIKEDAEAEAMTKIEAGDEVAKEAIAKAKKQVEKLVGDVPGKEIDGDDEVDGVATDRCWRYNGGVETGKIFAKGDVIPDGWTKKFTK